MLNAENLSSRRWLFKEKRNHDIIQNQKIKNESPSIDRYRWTNWARLIGHRFSRNHFLNPPIIYRQTMADRIEICIFRQTTRISGKTLLKSGWRLINPAGKSSFMVPVPDEKWIPAPISNRWSSAWRFDRISWATLKSAWHLCKITTSALCFVGKFIRIIGLLKRRRCKENTYAL